MANTTHGLIKSEHGRVKIPMFPIVVWRYFVTGESVGAPRDNASFLHDATLDYRNKPVPKHSKARWRRVARRNAVFTMPIVLEALALWLDLPLWLAPAWLGAVALAGLAWLARAIHRGVKLHNPIRFFRDYRVRKEFIYPAAETLCRLVSHRYVKSRARRMIELPHGWGTGADVDDGAPKVARLWLPADFSSDARIKAKIVSQIGAKLGIPHPVGEWNEVGATPFVDIQGAPTPPKDVTWAGLLPAIARAGEEEIIIGRAPGGRLLTLSTTEDSPHFAMSGSSGTGKSVTGKVFLSQRIRRGDGVFLLDPKRWSHWRWAGGSKIPQDRVIYAYKTEDIHNSWLAIDKEKERRIDMDEDELAVQRRVWIAVEEINTATKRLTRYWTGERKRRMTIAKVLLGEAKALLKDSGLSLEEAAAAVGLDLAELDLPAQSPAVVAMQESVGMGRELKMHVVVMAQRLSASVFGGNGGDIRESFQGGRLIARWDRRLWKMLVDTIDYVACPTGPRGIWGIARGEEFTVFRVPYLADKEATAYALGGAPVFGPVLGPQRERGVVEGQSWTGLAGDIEQPAISSAVKLSDALHLLPGQDGPAALSESALRKAAGRPGFPEPVLKPDGQEYGRREARLYDLNELVEWRLSKIG